MGTFFHAYTQADLFGKLIFFALFFLSSVSWIFLIQKFLTIKQIRLAAKRFEKVARLHKEELLQLQTKSQNPFGALFNSVKEQALIVLDKRHYFADRKDNYLSKADIEFLDSQLHTTIVKLKMKIEKNLFILPTAVALGPFLGLLGTVWGIFVSFGEMQGGQSVSSSAAILGGLSTALTTTILGLIVAIPALIGNSYLKSLSQIFTVEMVDFSHFLLSTIELQYRKIDISS